jgi:hypothetical protein
MLYLKKIRLCFLDFTDGPVQSTAAEPGGICDQSTPSQVAVRDARSIGPRQNRVWGSHSQLRLADILSRAAKSFCERWWRVNLSSPWTGELTVQGPNISKRKVYNLVIIIYFKKFIERKKIGLKLAIAG